MTNAQINVYCPFPIVTEKRINSLSKHPPNSVVVSPFPENNQPERFSDCEYPTRLLTFPCSMIPFFQKNGFITGSDGSTSSEPGSADSGTDGEEPKQPLQGWRNSLHYHGVNSKQAFIIACTLIAIWSSSIILVSVQTLCSVRRIVIDTLKWESLLPLSSSVWRFSFGLSNSNQTALEILDVL